MVQRPQETPKPIQQAKTPSNEEWADGEDNHPSNDLKEVKTQQESCLQVKKRALECRELLAQLRDLTYLCEKEEALNGLRNALQNNLTELRPHVPSDIGLFVERNPQRKFKAIKRAPMTQLQYADLPPRKKGKMPNHSGSNTIKRKSRPRRKQGQPSKPPTAAFPGPPNPQSPAQTVTEPNQAPPSKPPTAAFTGPPNPQSPAQTVTEPNQAPPSKPPTAAFPGPPNPQSPA